MKSYIFYKTSDGTIVMQKEYASVTSADTTLALNPGLAYIEGRVHDVNSFKVDISDLSITATTTPQFKPALDNMLRHKRNTLLKACDWAVGVDSPLSDSKKAEWQTYRQQLRDLPNTNTASTYSDIVWPTPPE